jgi:dTDP-4-dehydrorhamnose reductase
VSVAPRVLLFGRAGQVGGEVLHLLGGSGEVTAPAEGDVDFRDENGLRMAVQNARPEVIVNAAAYTAVDRAEEEGERDIAHAVNAVGPGALAEEAARLGALFIHYSTDYVFDGTKRRPYVEADPPAPLGVYGRTKLEGEERVLAAGGRSVILRTGWVYGPRGNNFLLTMLRLFMERSEVRVVDDQVGAPTTARYLAEATLKVINMSPDAEHCGLYHCTAGGQTSWCGFARRILLFDQRPKRRCKRVAPIRTADFPTPARRPAFSVLDSSRFAATFDFPQRSWDELLKETMAELAGEAAPAT